VYPDVSLEDARYKADMARQKLKQGIDPSVFKQMKSFEGVAREWLRGERGRWKDGYTKRVIHSLEQDVFPYIGHRNISAIKPAELLMMVQRVERRGALQVATKVLQRVSAVFRYAVQIGRINNNPASELVGAVRTKKVQHRKSLEVSQIPLFITSVKNYSGLVSVSHAILLMLLTFVRSEELRSASWSEFDLSRAVWRLPEARTKKDRVHIVPLSRQAVVLLKSLSSYKNYPKGYLFEGRRSGSPISNKTMIQAIYRMGYKGKTTVHGFRGLASTVLNESGLFSVDVIERQLAHIEGNAVRRAYNYAQYLPERERMMQWWADYLDGVQGIKKKKGFFNRFINLKQ
jgi:integrase